MVECDYCDKKFRNKKALEAHNQHKHPIEPDIFQGIPFTDAQGYWVLRQNFTNRKGFGMFQCSECFRYWSSAHAYKDKFRQKCQRCEIAVQPYIMWEFTEEPEPHDNDDASPHDALRCEACLAGEYCTTSRGDVTTSSNNIARLYGL
jgi:hypothetical protein